MKILDLFCGVGGASYGYHLAGATEIIGVDREPQPNYPFQFIKKCAISYLQNTDLSSFDFIHASPPCLAHSLANQNAKKQGKVYEDFVEITRELLIATGKPYCIENVMNAGLLSPIRLQGAMFGLPIIRKRDFETNFFLLQPPKINQCNDIQKGRCITVAGLGYQKDSPFKGKLKGNEQATMFETRKLAMQMPWAKTMTEVNNAVPPAYSRWILEQFLLQSL